jgi:hypothetical protein
LVLALSAEAAGDCYGAFKGASRQNFGALLRLLWTNVLSTSYAELPRTLLSERGPAEFELPGGTPAFHSRLRAFLLGESNELLAQLQAAARNGSVAFHLAFQQADLEAVEHFFRIGPQRNHFLRQRFGDGPHLIPQADLDDWIVRSRHHQSPAGRANAT